MREELYPKDASGKWPIISHDESVQSIYVDRRECGESHNIAEMIATRTTPNSLSDREFNRGRWNNNQFAGCPGLGNYYKKMADAAGVATTGKYYVHGLGRFPGDPRAWVKGRGDVQAIARERNLTLDGMIKHKPHEVAPTPDIPLAKDIWERDTQALLEVSPGMRYEDAKEKTFELRTGGLKADEKSIVTPISVEAASAACHIR